MNAAIFGVVASPLDFFLFFFGCDDQTSVLSCKVVFEDWQESNNQFRFQEQVEKLKQKLILTLGNATPLLLLEDQTKMKGENYQFHYIVFFRIISRLLPEANRQSLNNNIWTNIALQHHPYT